tara:strand:+ start:897 stop:1199 length:303 start_codon:yes stop_codon:yes gene_type:complete
MHRTVSVTVVLSLFFFNIPAHAEGDIGRYQLFQGEHPLINLRGEEHWIKALFKIDTATGQIYICGGMQGLGEHLNRKGEAYQITSCTAFEHDIEIHNYTK